jgi:hypothetical protein
MVIEINYTDTKEIIWWYGQPGNHGIIQHPHNPDRYENGNTVICDSGNSRVIEINTTTKEVVWEFQLEFPEGKLRWVRDCDEIGNYQRLITDSGNNRLLVYDMIRKDIIREIKTPLLMVPYEADLLDDGRIVVGGLMSGTIIFIDFASGGVLGIIGFPSNWLTPFILILDGLIFFLFAVFYEIKRSPKRKWLKLIDFRVYKNLIYSLICLLLLLFFNSIINFIWLFELNG